MNIDLNITFENEHINKLYDYVDYIFDKYDRTLFLADTKIGKTRISSKLALVKSLQNDNHKIIYIGKNLERNDSQRIISDMIKILSGDTKKIVRYMNQKIITFQNNSTIEYFDYINKETKYVTNYDLMIVDNGTDFLDSNFDPYKKIIYMTSKIPLKRERSIIKNNNFVIDDLRENLDLKYRNLKMDKIIDRIRK